MAGTEPHSPAPRTRRPMVTGVIVGVAAGLLLFIAASLGMFEWGKGIESLETTQTLERLEQLRALRESERSILTTYGWVDRPDGLVRIPVERAMELMVRDAAGGRRE